MRFRLLLGLMGTLLVTASRFSQAIQRQVWLRRVIEIGSDDGVVYHYTFEKRRVSFGRGPAENANCTIRFATARQGFRALTAANRFELMTAGLQNGTIQIGGDVAQFLWFEGLLRAAVPSRTPTVALPSRSVSPTEIAEVDKYIVREPEATHLDPLWSTAATQRNKLLIMRVPAAEPLESDG